MTNQIFRDINSLAFAFISNTFISNYLCFHKSTIGKRWYSRTVMELNRTYLKLLLNMSGEWPVCRLKNLIK